MRKSRLGKIQNNIKKFSIFVLCFLFPLFPRWKKTWIKKKFLSLYTLSLLYIPFARTAKKCYLIMSRSERYMACNYYASGAAYFFCVKWFDIWYDGEKDLFTMEIPNINLPCISYTNIFQEMTIFSSLVKLKTAKIQALMVFFSSKRIFMTKNCIF